MNIVFARHDGCQQDYCWILANAKQLNKVIGSALIAGSLSDEKGL